MGANPKLKYRNQQVIAVIARHVTLLLAYYYYYYYYYYRNRARGTQTKCFFLFCHVTLGLPLSYLFSSSALQADSSARLLLCLWGMVGLFIALAYFSSSLTSLYAWYSCSSLASCLFYILFAPLITWPNQFGFLLSESFGKTSVPCSIFSTCAVKR